MKPETLRLRDFYTYARGAADGDRSASTVGADWLDEVADDPLRAHIFRHGVREHQVADRGADAGRTYRPHNPTRIGPGSSPVPTADTRSGVIFADEGWNVRRLAGDTTVVGRLPVRPLAEHHSENSPEHYELFWAEPLSGHGPERLALRYTLHLGRRNLRIVAPVDAEHVRAMAEAMPEDSHEQREWMSRYYQLRRGEHQDRPTPLARPDEHNYNALTAAINATPEDMQARAVFADFLQENGIPGAHVARAHSQTPNDTNNPPIRARRLLGQAPGDSRSPHAEISHSPAVAMTDEGAVFGPDYTGTFSDFMKAHGDAPFMQLSIGRSGKGVAVMTLHHNPKGHRIGHVAHALTGDDLKSLLADLSPAAKAGLFSNDEATAAIRKALRGKGSRSFKLARTAFGAQQAPAGGYIGNNMYQKGGQFVARTRARIKDVAAKFTNRETGATGPTKLAKGDGKTRTTAMLGKGAEYDTPLTLGELKNIEATYGLKGADRMSHLATQSEGAVGDEHPYTVSIHDALPFYGRLARAAIGQKGKLKQALLGPKTSEAEKHVHLVTNLLGDFTDAPHGDWYSGAVDAMDVAFHKHFGVGKLHPDGRQLIGKGAPHEHHPELTLFKVLVGATSPLQNPVDNTRSAIGIWRAGLNAARRNGSDDVIAHMPTDNRDGLAAWLEKAARLNGVAKLPDPGTSPESRGLWYAKWVYPHRKELEAQSALGYAAAPGRVYIHSDPSHPHHGVLKQLDPGAKGRAPKHINPAAPEPAETDATLIAAAVPTVNADGTIRAKTWAGMSNPAERIEALRKIVDRFRTPHGGVKQAYRDAAKWLFEFHPQSDFDPKIQKQLARDGFFEPDEHVPGFMVFGPKIGAFMSNLHANDPATRHTHGAMFTHDTWMQRQLQGHLGRLTTDEKSKQVKPADRTAFRKAVEDLGKQLGATPAEIQADLWYYAQGLFRRLGVRGDRLPSLSFRDGANKFLPIAPHIDAVRRAGLATREGTPGAEPERLAREKSLHASLTAKLGGKTWGRHNRQCAIQKHGDGSISLLQHGKRLVTAFADGTVKKHAGKFYKGRPVTVKLNRVHESHQQQYDALVHQVGNQYGHGSDRGGDDRHTAMGVAADWLEEHGYPGGLALREAWEQRKTDGWLNREHLDIAHVEPFDPPGCMGGSGWGIDLDGVLDSDWGYPETPDGRRAAAAERYKRRGNVFASVARYANPDRIMLELMHTSHRGPQGAEVRSPTMRYKIALRSRQHLRGITADLPEPMRNAIHAAADPHLPETDHA